MARSYARQRTNMQPVPDTRLQGRRLVIARVIWAMLVVLTLVWMPRYALACIPVTSRIWRC
ncbi:MAG: hypothetical protein ACRDIV_08170 [Ktedonobacteraceae bacterium]